ncbi:hypothetical protein M432DRAFT_546348 [Thermoascus aurantiacus ATCC 26904]
MPDKTLYTSKLAGKRVVIFGGTSGIGFCVAEASIEHGATVIVSSSRPERVESAVSRIRESYPSAKDRISGHVLDLSSPTVEDAIAAFFEKIGGPIDHIVYTAGDALNLRPLESTTLESIQKVGAVRVFSAILVAKHAVKYLAKSNKSSFTLTSGSAADRPHGKGWAVGSLYGAGEYGLARALSLEMAPVRVNVVSPGAVKTELWDSLPPGTFQALKEKFESTLLTGQIGDPQDVAEAYLYCMKDANVTGTVISTNGGELLV